MQELASYGPQASSASGIVSSYSVDIVAAAAVTIAFYAAYWFLEFSNLLLEGMKAWLDSAGSEPPRR